MQKGRNVGFPARRYKQPADAIRLLVRLRFKSHAVAETTSVQHGACMESAQYCCCFRALASVDGKFGPCDGSVSLLPA